MSTGDWRERAVCAEADPEAWFPVKGANPSRVKAICATCPVRQQCLDFAISQEFRVDGIWGGTTEDERRPLRREKAAA